MSILDRMSKILETAPSQPAVEEEGAAEAGETSILQNLALAASAMGVDLDDADAVDTFIDEVKRAITKDKAKLKSQLRRFTSSKAKAAAKGALRSA